MKYIHPPFTGFPLAAVCFLLCFEVLRFTVIRERLNEKTRIFLLFAYLLSVCLSFITGYLGFEKLNLEQELSENILDHIALHYSYAKLILIFTLPFVLFGLLSFKLADKNTKIKILYLFFLLLNFALVLVAGAVGGDLLLTPEYIVEILGI